MVVPPRVVGYGVTAADAVVVARLVPIRLIRSFGLTFVLPETMVICAATRLLIVVQTIAAISSNNTKQRAYL